MLSLRVAILGFAGQSPLFDGMRSFDELSFQKPATDAQRLAFAERQLAKLPRRLGNCPPHGSSAIQEFGE